MARDRESEAVLDLAAAAAWHDFLSNRIAHAERRAAPFVLSLPSVLAAAAAAAVPAGGDGDDEALANRLVTLADLAHIAGAARSDAATLDLAVAAYDAHLARCPSNLGALRMRAETLLRCRRYDEAFDSFQQLYERSLATRVGGPSRIEPTAATEAANALSSSSEW